MRMVEPATATRSVIGSIIDTCVIVQSSDAHVVNIPVQIWSAAAVIRVIPAIHCAPAGGVAAIGRPMCVAAVGRCGDCGHDYIALL